MSKVYELSYLTLKQGSAKAGHLGRFSGPDVTQRLGQKSFDTAQIYQNRGSEKKSGPGENSGPGKIRAQPKN
jgi:hypothetical protein